MFDLVKQFGPLLVFALIVVAGVWGIRRYLRAQRRGRLPQAFTGGGAARDRDNDRLPRREE